MADRKSKLDPKQYSKIDAPSPSASIDSESHRIHSIMKLQKLNSISAHSPQSPNDDVVHHRDEKQLHLDDIHYQDLNYGTLHQMQQQTSIGDLVVTSSEIPAQDIATAMDDAEDPLIRNKYRQLKDKYIRLHKNYKKTKNLRVQNETLVHKNKIFEAQMNELKQHMMSQKETIIRQNIHLLKLREERDDFADTVQEHEEVRRLTEQYGTSPLLKLNFTPSSLKGNPLESGHARSGTTPLVFKQLKSASTVIPEEDVNFEEDEKFTMQFVPGLDEDDDDEDEVDEKYSSTLTPSHTATAGGPTTTDGAISGKKARFVEVDDITRDVERKYYAMSRSVLRSKINPLRVKELWSNILGENTDDRSIVEESAEICDAWTIDECECGQRLLFIMKYYSQWLDYKQYLGKRKSRGARDVFTHSYGDMAGAAAATEHSYVPAISDFISGTLEYYNDIQLLNDFFHVKKYHISDTAHFNSDKVFAYFVNEFGFCDVKHCTSFRRNHREKSIFGHHNRFRRKVYHLNKKEFKNIDEYNENADNRYELQEIYMQQTLDMIHSTLIHDHENCTMDNLSEFAKQLLKSPLTMTDDPEFSAAEQSQSASNVKDGTRFGYKQMINSVSTRTARVSVIASPENSPGPPSMPIPLSPQQEDPSSNTQDVFSYGFGVRFSYWIRQWPDFVHPQYGDLRTELLENDIYRVSAFEWDLLEHRAAVFLQTNYGISEYVAQRQGSGNELMCIAPGSRLSINHLIALFTYTNYANIRIAFQKACLRITPDETFVSVLKRHCQIACWARLLYEAVYLFGCRMKDNNKFYHILRSKIMLRKFSANLSCPTTMIANRKIVNNSNIVMQVANAHSRGATYLDVSCFSDVPNREERLFFFGDLAFDNIILKGKSHRHYIKSLTLFQKIVQGSYFSHTSLKKKEYQETITHFMENLMKSKDRGDTSNYVHMLRERKKYNDEDIIADNDVPLYMQHLFDYFCGKIKTIWVNQEEFSKLQANLAKYLAKPKQNASIVSIQELMLSSSDKQSMMGAFTKFLHFEYSANIKYCCTLKWEISGAALKQFRKGQKVFGEEFRVSTIRLFPYIVKDSSKNDGQFRFGIPVKSMPKYLKKIEFRVDLYIEEVNYTFSSFSIIDERGTYWYSLFDSSKLRNFEAFTLKISFRLINLIVSSANASGTRAKNNEANAQKNRHVANPSRSIQHRGSNSIFNLENFRRVSGAKRQSVVQRLSRVSNKFKGSDDKEKTVVIKM